MHCRSEPGSGLARQTNGFPESEALETFVLEEYEERTPITTTTLHPSVEARDGHVGNGLEEGMSEGHGRLDELLASLPQGAATHPAR